MELIWDYEVRKSTFWLWYILRALKVIASTPTAYGTSIHVYARFFETYYKPILNKKVL